LLIVIYKTLDNLSQITTAISRFLLVISPLLYGVLFAYFFYTPHIKIEKLYSKAKVAFFAKRARVFSTLTVFLLLILIIAFIGIVIVPIMISSMADLAGSLPIYIAQILDFLDNVPEDSIWSSLNLADVLRDSSGDFINQYVNPAGIEQVAKGIINVAGEVFNVLLGLVISLYLLLDRKRIIGFFKQLVTSIFKNEKARSTIRRYLLHINDVLFTFIASKGLDSIINFVVVTCMLLIFNVPYAFLLGLIAGLFNFIPYLGSLIAVILICSITLITDGVSKVIQILLPLMVFQQLDGNFIEPRIMKSSLKISPILVIIAVVVGGEYFGILGMFLAVPIAAVVKQILVEYANSSESDHLEQQG